MKLCRTTNSSPARFNSTSNDLSALRGDKRPRQLAWMQCMFTLSLRAGSFCSAGWFCSWSRTRWHSRAIRPSQQVLELIPGGTPILKPVLVESHLLEAHAAQKPATPVSLPEEVPHQLHGWHYLCLLQQRSLDSFSPGAPAGDRRSPSGCESAEIADLFPAPAGRGRDQGYLPVPDPLDHDRHFARD